MHEIFVLDALVALHQEVCLGLVYALALHFLFDLFQKFGTGVWSFVRVGFTLGIMGTRRLWSGAGFPVAWLLNFQAMILIILSSIRIANDVADVFRYCSHCLI